jgi:hypothetical protein
MDGEQQLFSGAVEAAIISAQFHLGEGWTLRLQLRRQFEDWADARTELYDRLSTDELVDTLDAALGTVRVELGY